MPVNNEFEVKFDIYCKTCEYFGTSEVADPCNYCLSRYVNINSHKPVCYKGVEKW